MLVDQTLLPHSLVLREVHTVDELVEAIQHLRVRGAPALGVAGALGVALALAQAEREGWDHEAIEVALGKLRAARPTAVNLAWGVDQVTRHLGDAEHAALELMEREIAASHEIGERGADLLSSWHEGPLVVHTHCNTGALACVEWGTALGVVRSLHRRGWCAR